MNSTLILVICGVLLVLIGCWLGYSSKPNKEARKLLAEKEEKEFLQKAKEQEEGREKNRREVFRKETLEVVCSVFAYPEKLRGTGYEISPLRLFIKKVNESTEHDRDLQYWKDRVSKQSDLIRDLQGQLKEINKALQLGQPVE